MDGWVISYIVTTLRRHTRWSTAGEEDSIRFPISNFLAPGVDSGAIPSVAVAVAVNCRLAVRQAAAGMGISDE